MQVTSRNPEQRKQPVHTGTDITEQPLATATGAFNTIITKPNNGNAANVTFKRIPLENTYAIRQMVL